MVALLIFLLLLIFFSLTFLIVRDIWHPSALIYIPWLVIFAGLFFAEKDFIAFKFGPFITIFIGIVSISVGGLFFVGKNKAKDVFPGFTNVDITPFIQFLVVVFVLYLPIFFEQRLHSLAGALTLSGLRQASLEGGAESGGTLPNRIMQVFLLIIVMLIYNRLRREARGRLLTVSLLFYCGYMLLMGNKAYFIQILLVVGALILTSRKYRPGQMVVRGLVVLAIALLILGVMRALRDGNGNFFKQIEIYLLSGVVIFQERLPKISTDQWLVPLGQINSIFHSLGLQNLPDVGSSLPFTYVGNGIEGNTATVFFYFFQCGGLFGVFFFSVLTGFIHTFAYAKAIQGSIRSYIFYLYLNAYLFITFFDLGFISMLVSTGFFGFAVFLLVRNGAKKSFQMDVSRDITLKTI